LSNAGPTPRFGMHGSALVALDDERATLATVLVLQEMGLAVDIAVDRDRSVDWARQAGYSYVVCGGDGDEAGVKDFAAKMRFAVPETRVFLLAGSDFDSSGLEAIGVEVLPSPVEVNSLVERLWPAQAA
jgi:hypothetical protein